jgi:hypothetical protein
VSRTFEEKDITACRVDCMFRDAGMDLCVHLYCATRGSQHDDSLLGSLQPYTLVLERKMEVVVEWGRILGLAAPMHLGRTNGLFVHHF